MPPAGILHTEMDEETLLELEIQQDLERIDLDDGQVIADDDDVEINNNEVLPINGEDAVPGSDDESASEGDISSTPSSEALSPSDDNLADIPYLDMTSHPQDGTPLAPPTSSSEEDLTRPPPLPPRDTGTGGDRLIATERLILPKPSSLPAPVAPPRTSRRSAESRPSGSSPQPSPQLPRPQATKLRRTSLEKVGTTPADTTTTTPRPKAADKPLIHFESSESEADGLEQFDPLHSKPAGRSSGSPAAAGAPDTSPPLPSSSSHSLTRNRSSRNSLMRSGAFRKAPSDAPVRAGYREDEATLDEEKGAKDKVADLFDPLASLSVTNPAFSSSKPGNADVSGSAQKSGGSGGGGSGGGGGGGSGGEAGSGSLMQDWTLDHLAAGTGLTRPPSGGGQFSAPAFGTQFPPPSGSRPPFSRPPSSSSSSSTFSRVPSGGTLTCPSTATPSPFPPAASLTSNPLYVAPPTTMTTTTITTSSVQANPLYQPPSSQPGRGSGIVQSNPLYQLPSSSIPKPATGDTWSTSISTSSGPRPRHSQGPPAGPGRASQGRLLQQSTKGVEGGVGGAVNSGQVKPPPARRWETFD